MNRVICTCPLSLLLIVCGCNQSDEGTAEVKSQTRNVVATPQPAEVVTPGEPPKPTPAQPEIPEPKSDPPSKPSASGYLLNEKVTAESLRKLDDPDRDDLDLYIRLSRNADVEIRLRAIKAIAQIDANEPISNAISSCAVDPEAKVRRQVAQYIYDMDYKTPAALGAIRSLLNDQNSEVVETAILAVRQFSDAGERMEPDLVRLITEGTDSVSETAIDVLKEIGPTTKARTVLKSAFAKHGETALYAIAEIKPVPTEMLPWLRQIMASDEDTDHRLAAAWALGRFGETTSLIEAATSKDAGKRALGMEGLGGLREPTEQALLTLAAGLKDPDEEVCRCAADAVAYLKKPSDELLAALMRTFANKHWRVRKQCHDSLETLATREKEHERLVALVDSQLEQTPDDIGLLLAKVTLVYPLAYEALGYDDKANLKALALFESGAAGLIRVVLKSDFELAAFEKQEISTHFYDSACAACRCRKYELGLKYLTIALETGWGNIRHLKRDSDLDPLREMQGYRDLIKKYDK